MDTLEKSLQELNGLWTVDTPVMTLRDEVFICHVDIAVRLRLARSRASLLDAINLLSSDVGESTEQNIDEYYVKCETLIRQIDKYIDGLKLPHDRTYDIVKATLPINQYAALDDAEKRIEDYIRDGKKDLNRFYAVLKLL